MHDLELWITPLKSLSGLFVFFFFYSPPEKIGISFPIYFYFLLYRFQDWKSEKSSDGGYGNERFHSRTFRRTLHSVSDIFHRGFESGSGRIKSLKVSFKSFSLNNLLPRDFGDGKPILDPQGTFLQRWNKIFVLSCIVAISLDPLFFYIPIIDNDKKCLTLDQKLEITACILRFFTDIFYLIHIIFQFRTGFIAPSSRVFGRGVLVEDSWAIAKRYLSSYFLIDILAVLPLPQVREIRWLKCSVNKAYLKICKSFLNSPCLMILQHAGWQFSRVSFFLG